MSREEDRWNTLYEVSQVVSRGNYVTFDTETTSLDGQIIQWAVCDHTGQVLGTGYVKPTEPISEGARAIHGITDEMLLDAPTFDLIAQKIWDLIEGKAVIIYNASFDISRLYSSLAPYIDYQNQECPHHKRVVWLLSTLERHCAMEWFAVIYGAKHEYFKTYTWQKLETACFYFDIQGEKAHDAASDAKATALLVKKLAELAQEELPEGYHPPREEPCTGGCGQTLGSFRYDEDKTWYCLECGLKAGINHLCSRCQEKGKRTIVTSYRSEKEILPPDKLCYQCEYEVNMAAGTWHRCPVCTRIVQFPMEEQRMCKQCTANEEREKAKRRAYQQDLRKRRRTGALTAHEQSLLERWESLMQFDLSRTVLSGYYILIEGEHLNLPEWSRRVIWRREIRLETSMKQPTKRYIWHRGKWIYIERLEKHWQLYQAVALKP